MVINAFVKKNPFCYNWINMKKVKFSQKQINQFKRLGVDIIYLFGSYAQGFTHPLSDIDIGIVFNKPEKYKNKKMKAYLKLYDIFTDIFPEIKEVDIVFLQFTPLSLQLDAIREGMVLYERDEETRFNYQEMVMKKHADIKYFYDLSNKYLLERI